MLNKPLAHRDVSSALQGRSQDGDLFFSSGPALGHPYMFICSAPPAEEREVAATASLAEPESLPKPETGCDSSLRAPSRQGGGAHWQLDRYFQEYFLRLQCDNEPCLEGLQISCPLSRGGGRCLADAFSAAGPLWPFGPLAQGESSSLLCAMQEAA
jgi:hypothetical protein